MTSDFAHKGCLHRAIAVAAIAAVSALAAAPARAADDDIIVKYDQSQLLRLKWPAAEIIVGNPSIADVSVQSGNLLVITGKSFGVTNIITLDADRNVIQDQRVVVDQDDRRTVSVYRGPLRQTFTCAPVCTPALVIGDDPKFFDAVTRMAQTKTGGSAPVNQTPQSQ